MSSTTIAKASRIDRALERLEAAVLRLDTSIGSVQSTPNDGESADVAALRAENAELKNLNLSAAEKLSQTIQRLEAALQQEEGNG